MKKRDKYLILTMFNIWWFTIAVLYINLKGHNVSSELIIAWFSAWTVELALLAGIKLKNRGEKDG